MMTYSFPCQDLSLAGKQKGMAKGENTRSGLLWEVERLLNECTELPQVLLMENVTQVHGTKNKEHFDEWIKFLESKGYSNYWKDLNAKNFGIPQNRNRTFMVSVLGDYTYEFPKEFPLELRLKDMLEDSVDEKFYLSDRAIKGIENSTYERKQHIVQKKDWCDTLLSRDYKDPKCVEIEEPHLDIALNLYEMGVKGFNRDTGEVLKSSGICKTIQTMQGGNRQPKVAECYVSEKGVKYICDPKRGMATDVNAQISQPLTAKGQSNWTGSFISPDIESLEKSSTIGGNEPTKINLKNGETVYFDGKNFSSIEKTEQLLSAVKDGKYPQDTAYGKYLFQSSRFDDKPLEECSQTIKSTKVDCGVIHNLRIRKLTPKECWRLMGFDDADFEKAKYYTEEEVATLKLRSSKKHKDLPLIEKIERTSNGQLYKQAGNSIVVDVLYYIFRQMIAESEETL